MKKSIILLELIFTIVIISIVAIFTMTFLYSLYKKLSFEYSNEIRKLELSSSNIFLEKLLSKAKNINLSNKQISFYKEDTSLFKQDIYSKFIDLNKSNKNTLYSANTKAENLIDYYLSFDSKIFYSIKDDSFNENIYLDNNEPKRVYEFYEIYSIDHFIKCENDTLLYNDNILLENISACSFSKNDNNINITFRKDEIQITWNYEIQND